MAGDRDYDQGVLPVGNRFAGNEFDTRNQGGYRSRPKRPKSFHVIGDKVLVVLDPDLALVVSDVLMNSGINNTAVYALGQLLRTDVELNFPDTQR